MNDFYRDAHRLIYEAMLDLFAKREPIDILSLTNTLEERKLLEMVGGRSYLVSLTNTVPTASHVAMYSGIVQKKATLRRLIGAAADIAKLGYQEEDEADALLDEAESRLFAVSQKHLKRAFISIRDVLTDAFERIDELHRAAGTLRGLPTGFRDLDNVLAGFQKSDLIVLAARPSLGKTSLALDFARHVATHAKKSVGIFSLEMSKDQLVDRLLCSEAGVELWRMRTGKLSDRPEDDDFPRIGNAMGTLADAPIFIDDTANTNVMEIRAKARRLQSEHGLSMIIVDYLQLMEGRKSVDSRVQEVAEITRGLKGIARELSVPVLALSQLSRATEMRSPAIPKLSDLRESGCVTGDTLITNADTGERMPIASLVGKKNIPVFSLNAQWQLERRIMTSIFPSGRKKVFALRTRSGRTIKASANHPFLTIEGWKRLDELSPDQKIALPRQLNHEKPTTAISNDELGLLAHLLGDGCVLPRQPIHYTSADPKNIAFVAATATKLFGITPRIVTQKNWKHVYLPSPYRLTHGKPHPITRWFQHMGISLVRSYEKRIPESVFTASKEHIAYFLHHLWATDGNISWKKLAGRLPAAAIYYATTSPLLAEQVQHLLLQIGIWSTVRAVPQKKKGKTYRTNYHVHVQGADQQLRFCAAVGSFGNRGHIIPELIQALRHIAQNPNTDALPRDVWMTHINPARKDAQWSWRDFASEIGMSYCGSTLFKHGVSRERMTRVATALASPPLFQLATSDVYWDAITAIEPLGTKDVFDATVPGTHNFVANDIIIHNSIEQDADVVMFIYRKIMDKSVKDLLPEQRHIAEIHIAKHRNGPTGMVELFFDERLVSFRNLEKRQSDPFVTQH